MIDVLTMVLAGGKGERLHPLTSERAKPAVPFGGAYRIIDFTLSNTVNSGLKQVIVLTQYKSFSLERHIKIGWNILGRALGEYIDAMPPQQKMGEDWYRGTADAIYQNNYYIRRLAPKRVLVLSGDHVYRMDYAPFLKYHDEKQARVTMACIEVPVAEARTLGVLQVDEQWRVIGFQEKSQTPQEIPGKPGWCLANMGVYVFDRAFLLDELDAEAERVKAGSSSWDFGKDMLPRFAAEQKAVFAYPFRDGDGQPGYWRDVGTISAYLEANLDLVAVSPRFNLYDFRWPIRTFSLPLPPAKFVFAQDYEGGRRGVALDSIVCAGAILSGGRVRDSVVGSLVRVNSFAEVDRSILFEGVIVGRHCRLRNTIIDKDVEIPPGAEIGYHLDEDRKHYHVTPEGIVVIEKRRGELKATPGFSSEI
ncbi:MAG: glucose-1-phosphate adenylyltransferase [Planctomycetes bacterium]|nr:glucose-1-phosphate adenylyltransferase [Planctomycetota bacterium]